MLVTLSGAIESISEFCLPSRIRHGAGDEVLYPVIVFVIGSARKQEDSYKWQYFAIKLHEEHGNSLYCTESVLK